MTKKFLIGSAIAGIMMAGGVAVAAPDSHGPWGADANGDGNLTKVEMTASLDKALAKFDTNSDGQVTEAELDAKRDERCGKSVVWGKRWAGRVDLGGRGIMKKKKR